MISCLNGNSSCEDLRRYVEDESNGCSKSITKDGSVIRVSYRPTDLLIAQEISDERLDAETISQLKKKYSQYYYFVVSVSIAGNEAIHNGLRANNYDNIVRTMSFRMQDYISLTTSLSDTVSFADALMDRTYGLARSTNLLLAFKRSDFGHDAEWMDVNVKEFGVGVGNNSFRFRLKDIEQASMLSSI